MYNSDKVIPGIIIFAAIVLFPIWWNHGKAVSAPKVKVPEGSCVESREFMRANHMQLLNEWRNLAIREGMRFYESSTGKRFWISLQNECMKCHSSKKEFCDKCHEFSAVRPYCWNCHIPPEVKKFGPPEESVLYKIFGIPVKLGEQKKVSEHHGAKEKKGHH